MGYVTPPGVDEREVPYPKSLTEEQVENLQKAGIKFVNWNGYIFPEGTGFGMKFLNQVQTRLNDNQSAIVLVTGPPGVGKTYFAMKLAEMFDKKLDINEQLCFSRQHLLKILSGEVKLKKRQALIIDEAHMATGARSWGKPEQQDLVNLLAAARSKVYFILIVVLHMTMVDVIIRKFMGTYMIGMEKPGVGIPYRLYTPRFQSEVYKTRYDPLELGLPDAHKCNHPDCLDCGFRDTCNTSRAIYERNKITFLDGVAKAARDRIEAQLKIVERPTRQELIKIIYNEHRDKLRYNNRGRIDYISIIDIVEDEGWAVGGSLAQSIAKSLYEKHGDLRPM